MLRCFQLPAALLACLCAGSGLWDAAQVLAWTRMIAREVPQVGLAAALDRTFRPGATCEFCEAIAEARRADREQAPATSGMAEGRKVFWCLAQSTPPVVSGPAGAILGRPDSRVVYPRREQKPGRRPPRE